MQKKSLIVILCLLIHSLSSQAKVLFINEITDYPKPSCGKKLISNTDDPVPYYKDMDDQYDLFKTNIKNLFLEQDNIRYVHLGKQDNSFFVVIEDEQNPPDKCRDYLNAAYDKIRQALESNKIHYHEKGYIPYDIVGYLTVLDNKLHPQPSHYWVKREFREAMKNEDNFRTYFAKPK